MALANNEYKKKTLNLVLNQQRIAGPVQFSWEYRGR